MLRLKQYLVDILPSNAFLTIWNEKTTRTWLLLFPPSQCAEDLDDVTEEKIALVKSAARKVTKEITIKLKG